MAWTLTVDGQVYREGDLTIDEAEAMEQATGVTWRQLNPLRSAAVAKGIACVLFERRGGMSAEEARRKVGALKVDELLDMVGTYDPTDDLPATYEDGFPPTGAGTSTST